MSELSEEEQGAILERVFQRLVNRISMMTHRAVRLRWDSSQETAGTDCVAEVRMNPWFFLNGQEQVGFGMCTHEAGHICWSPRGVELLDQARRDGGPTRKFIMNIILDRKDDWLTAQDNPGYADELRGRLLYLCTMSFRPLVRSACPDLDEDQVTALLHQWKPDDVWLDFFFAAKWHKHARFKRTVRAMRFLSRGRLLKASDDRLLWIAKRIHEILGKRESFESDQQRKDRREAERIFRQLCLIAATIESGSVDRDSQDGEIDPEFLSTIEPLLAKLDPKTEGMLKGIAKAYVAGVRAAGMQQLIRQIKNGVIYPGPVSVGTVDHINLVTVRPDSKYADANRRLRAEIESHVEPLCRRLRRLDGPSRFTLFGQPEGELDLDNSIVGIALGSPDVYREEIIERETDAAIHLAVDTSGSMYGEKLRIAKQIAIAFSAATETLNDNIDGRLWCYDTSGVYDYGSPNSNSGFVAHEAQGANSDTHMLSIVGPRLARSERKRKILLVLCDDGPDSIEKARRLSEQLLARGILVVHLMVGVHYAPNIYPIELIYSSMEECFEQFGELIETIVSNMR
ncbi:hypothetical protein COY93_04955 [Candidatus Uhrbacteria bacterium CG_4_10_14_0_8_um_filter_58_22]|uniref:VWFA domain-containing protein n=1 Tax=Candidatus Uhrbacteria bacterium CG_4_10_14_0_8_um_filter_58_22 TaxID=1975029 RepID=A0A2M7Q9E8_9BACT|nr:MAG: hypothetical protein AUJ19_00015 [Parcubacteria group bacterium CG1_02_58_44]PIY61638.1 MAG: hypothetical protein COY93_04955 [Candidatus Uhrbacteria bacterium CG_4_10_14_0_8_um_filter_58_22]